MPYIKKEVQKAAVKKNQNYKRLEYQASKEANPCVDCGNFFPYYLMQHDHRVGETKRFVLSQRSASFGSVLFMEEMAKCDLLCGHCHATRTWKRLQGTQV